MTTLRSSSVIRNSDYVDGSVGKLPQLLGRVRLDTISDDKSNEDTDKGNVDRRLRSKGASVKVFAVRNKSSLVIECIFSREDNASECVEMMNSLAGATDVFEVASLHTED